MDKRIGAPVLVLQGAQDQVPPTVMVAAVIAEMEKRARALGALQPDPPRVRQPRGGQHPNVRLVYSARSAARARRTITDFLDEVAGGRVSARDT